MYRLFIIFACFDPFKYESIISNWMSLHSNYFEIHQKPQLWNVFWFFTIRYLLTYMHWYLYVCQLLFCRYISFSCLSCSFCRSSVWWSWWWWSTPPAGFLWTSSTSPETSTPPSTTPRAWTTSGCHFTGSPWATVCTTPSSTVGWTRNSGMGSGGYWVTSRAVTLKWRTRWSCLTSDGRTQWIRR